MTAVTDELVGDPKGGGAAAELRLEMVQAVSGFHTALEKRGTAFHTALEKRGTAFHTALEKQGAAFYTALKEQGAEFCIALERHSATLDRRLATNAYWMAGGMAATSLALFGTVIALIT